MFSPLRVFVVLASLVLLGGVAHAETVTYLRKVNVTGKLTFAQAKRLAQSLTGPSALTFGMMPPGARLVRKGPGYIKAKTFMGQTVTEHLSAAREGNKVYIVGAARTHGWIPFSGGMAAGVHMLFTSPSLGAKNIGKRSDLPQWELSKMWVGESRAYSKARSRHYQQKREIAREAKSPAAEREARGLLNRLGRRL